MPIARMAILERKMDVIEWDQHWFTSIIFKLTAAGKIGSRSEDTIEHYCALLSLK